MRPDSANTMKSAALRCVVSALALTLLGVSGCGETDSGTELLGPEGRSRLDARILFNSDGGSGALFAFEPPITPDQLCRVVDALEGTQVDVFIQSISFGPFVLYGTKVGEIYGQNLGQFKLENYRRWALNVLGLLEQGLDPLDIWAKRSHELGMQFWPSLRLNDIHKDWVDRRPSLRSEWEKARTHLLIGSGVSDRYFRMYQRDYSWAFDFAHQEVRDLKFALIEEVCLNYEVNGFEIDFLRHPMFFKKGEEKPGMPLMTQFVRRVRNRMNEIARQKNCRIILAVRVPPTLDLCRSVGLDVRTWIQEELVDVVSPMTNQNQLDMNAQVRGFVEAARGTTCTIAGGLSDIYVRRYPQKRSSRASLEMLRAAAQGYWSEGASHIYLFNYDGHASSIRRGRPDATRPGAGALFNQKELQALTEIGDPAEIERKDKHYFLGRSPKDTPPEEGGEMQLPRFLRRTGEKAHFRFTLGDDLDSARRDGVLDSSLLQVFVEGNADQTQSLEFQLNGKALKGQSRDGTWSFMDPPLVQHQNHLVSTLVRGPGTAAVQEVEILLDYANAH